MKTVTKYVIGTIIYFLSFIVANEIIFCVKGAIPDTLVTCALGGGLVELIITFLLHSAGEKKDKDDDAWIKACIDDEDDIKG